MAIISGYNEHILNVYKPYLRKIPGKLKKRSPGNLVLSFDKPSH